jgi:hypothetical protein
VVFDTDGTCAKNERAYSGELHKLKRGEVVVAFR